MTPDRWGKCAIWGTDARTDVSDHSMIVESARAGGRYKITDSALLSLEYVRSDIRRLLSATEYIWRENQVGNLPLLDTNHLEVILETPLPSVAERIDRFLLAIDQRSKRPGKEVDLAQDDPAFLAAIAAEDRNGEEFWYLAGALNDQGYIKLEGILGPVDTATLTPTGFQRIAQLRQVKANTDQAFVAMWFSPSMDSAYFEGFEPAISAAGYRAMRIDKKEHNNKIDDEIIAEIRRSRFLVADFTSEPEKARGGVYFEAGFAMGLQLPVIWTCRKDCLSHVHFDTRQFSHVVWETPSDLREALSNRISATIGDGPARASRQS